MKKGRRELFKGGRETIYAPANFNLGLYLALRGD